MLVWDTGEPVMVHTPHLRKKVSTLTFCFGWFTHPFDTKTDIW